MPTLMDGKTVAAKLLEDTRGRVEAFRERTGKQPCLATVLVGSDPASVTYTQMKRKRCESIGMRSLKLELPATTSTHGLVEAIEKLGADPDVHGILLQHPVPSHIDERAAFEAIPVSKDVDGVTYGSFANQWFEPTTREGRRRHFESCTPSGIIRLLDAYEVNLEGKHAVVIGRSAILGKPMAALLVQRHATVTICHSRTRDLPTIVRTADIVVAAVGKPNFVQGDWLADGAIVMDAGYNPGNVGDVDFESAKTKASLITPVPGGVGPMTIAVLISQTADAAEQLSG